MLQCGQVLGLLLQWGRNLVRCEQHLNCPFTSGLHAATTSLFCVQNNRQWPQSMPCVRFLMLQIHFQEHTHTQKERRHSYKVYSEHAVEYYIPGYSP